MAAPWQAIDAIEQLKQNVDTLIIIPNDKLLDAVDPNMPVRAAQGRKEGRLRAAGGGAEMGAAQARVGLGLVLA